MNYLDFIHPPAAVPSSAGNQAVKVGVVYSYDDVTALIDKARALALANLPSGAGPIDVAYGSHVITALKQARDAVLRAGTQGAAGYHGSELAADFQAVNGIVSKVWDDDIGIYEREINNAFQLHQQVVALTVYNDFTVLGADLFPADFRANVVEFLNGLSDALKAFRGYESWAHFLGEGGLIGFIGEAIGAVVNALSGVWGLARGIAAAFAGIGTLAPVIVWGGAGLVGYWAVTKSGLLGAAKS